MTRIVLAEKRIDAKEGDLCVWWIRNPPDSPQYFPVATPEDAIVVLNGLAESDLQNEAVWGNAGGLEVFEDGEWTEWYSEDGDSIDEMEATK